MRTRYEVELLKKLCSCMGGSSRKVQAMRTLSVPRPSTPPVMRSPRTTGPTPSGAGIDQVAGFQTEVLRQVGHGLGHRPDELADVAALLVAPLTCSQMPARAMSGSAAAGAAGRSARSGRRPCPAPRGGRPRASSSAGRGASCPGPRHSPRHGPARFPRRCSHRPCQWRRPARFHSAGWRSGRVGQRQRLALGHRHHGIGRLAEEEGRFAVRVEAHLAGMGGVVAAHAIDAAHGIAVGAAVTGTATGAAGQRRKTWITLLMRDCRKTERRAGPRVQSARASRQTPSAACTGRSE